MRGVDFCPHLRAEHVRGCEVGEMKRDGMGWDGMGLTGSKRCSCIEWLFVLSCYRLSQFILSFRAERGNVHHRHSK